MTLAAEAQEGQGPGLSARNSPAQAGGPRSGSIDLACAVKRIGQSDVRRIAAAAVVRAFGKGCGAEIGATPMASSRRSFLP
jgi:hypothetical protein